MSRRGIEEERGKEEETSCRRADGRSKEKRISCLPSVLAHIYMLLRQRAPLRGVISSFHVSWCCCLAT